MNKRRKLMFWVPSGSFSPASISGLIADYNPATYGLNDSDTIVSLAESVNGYHGTQATGTKRATYKTNIYNGHPVARFDGGDGYQTAAIDLTGTSALTAVWVGSVGSGATDQIFVEASTNYSSSQVGWVFYKKTDHRFEASHNGDVGQNINRSVRTFAGASAVYTGIWDKGIVEIANGLRSGVTETAVFTNGLQAWSSLSKGSASNNTNAFGNLALNIGARNAGASLFTTGDMARLLIYNRKLTGAERVQLEAYLMLRYGITGGSAGSILFEGDSMTAGTNAVAPFYPEQTATLLANDGYAYNWASSGVDGAQVSEMITDATTWGTYQALGTHGKQVAVVWGGTNDLHFGATPATAHTRLAQHCAAFRAGGYKVIVLTMLPRSDGTTQASYQDKTDLNALILANYTGYADAVADVAADGRIGDDGDELDTTYYTADKVHLNNTGLSIVAGIVKTVVEAL